MVGAVVIVVDALEVTRRSFGKSVNVFYILGMVILRTPMTLQEVMPFIMIISGMLCYVKLSRSSELIILRASGLPALKFMLPSMFAAFVVGFLHVTILTPITSKMFYKAEVMEDKLVRNKSAKASALSHGVWLKEYVPDIGNVVIHAKSVIRDASELEKVKFLIFDNNFAFKKRIDAENAKITDEGWILSNINASTIKSLHNKFDQMIFRTSINIERLQDSFAKPNNLSLWQLPQFIGNMKLAGFSAIRHVQYYYSLLLLPFTLAAMTLISGCFALRISNRIQNNYELIIGIIVSFIVYFVTQMINAMGLSNSIPLLLSAVAPIILTTAFAIFIILHREGG
ncbi:MAG: hypothetical protein BGO27_01180 [Alphaproteobacteria bacterium 33-17]|nr:MAG: hypothetical protein BGO27_01180 [Alphaproteobacteria bacterium 33-17]